MGIQHRTAFKRLNNFSYKGELIMEEKEVVTNVTENEATVVTEIVKADYVLGSLSFQAEEIQQYKNICDNIHKEITGVESSYLKIALELYKIRQKRLYQIDNYANVYDMAYDKFMLSRGTCCNYINICEKFGIIDEATGECTGLLPEYEDFSSSKLVAMLQLPKELCKEITPNMSVREIRRKRQIYEERLQPELTTKKPGKKKTIELLKTNNIAEVIDKDSSTLLEKYDSFIKDHPDGKYTISITLVPQE